MASSARTSKTSGATTRATRGCGPLSRPRPPCSTAVRIPTRTSRTAGRRRPRSEETASSRRTGMAEADWTYLNNGLDIATVDRGVTAGIARPPGGGNFLFGFNSLAAVQGAVGLFCNLLDFAPMAKGASIRGCIQRGPSGGPTGFAPFLFLACQGNSVNDTAYLLGLSDDDPHRIVLRKGTVAVGIPDSEGPNVLLASGESFSQGTWLHLRLDV